MDYSKLVNAVLEEDENSLAEIVVIITRVLRSFLRVRYGASREDAEDCAQNALLIGIEKIREGQIEHPDAIISYLFTVSKNEYFKIISRGKDISFTEFNEQYNSQPDQLAALIDDEKLAILRACIDKLKDDFKQFITYWLQHAESEALAIANHFGISVNNAWTRKHRIVSLLKKCYQEKNEL